jgi:hypothetical protein
MKHAWSKKIITITSTLGSRTRWSAFIAVLIGSVLLAAAVRAYNHSTLNGVNVTKPSTALPSRQAIAPQRVKLQSRLSLQPEANKLRRRLGKRFIVAGKERSILVGTLTVGTQRSQVTVIRTQDDEGEKVEIALGVGPPSLTWNGTDGAKSAGKVADDVERSLIERLALDSPDQFVLAQLRGASYYTIARAAGSSGASDSKDYNGPFWDVVRVGEPEQATVNAPLSKWRIFHINTTTGLIDRIISQEQGEIVVAEISEWTDQGGEKVPTHISWSRGGKVGMELSLNNVAIGAR